jgi:hypothetical protein
VVSRRLQLAVVVPMAVSTAVAGGSQEASNSTDGSAGTKSWHGCCKTSSSGSADSGRRRKLNLRDDPRPVPLGMGESSMGLGQRRAGSDDSSVEVSYTCFPNLS